MLKQIGVFDLIRLVKESIQEKTQIPCYEEVQNGVQLPYCYVELNGKEASNNNTMWKDTFTVHIHIVYDENETESLSAIETAMKDGIVLPETYRLLLQTNTGIESKKLNMNNQKEVVVSYEYVICYGYKCKI